MQRAEQLDTVRSGERVCRRSRQNGLTRAAAEIDEALAGLRREPAQRSEKGLDPHLAKLDAIMEHARLALLPLCIPCDSVPVDIAVRRLDERTHIGGGRVVSSGH